VARGWVCVWKFILPEEREDIMNRVGKVCFVSSFQRLLLTSYCSLGTAPSCLPRSPYMRQTFAFRPELEFCIWFNKNIYFENFRKQWIISTAIFYLNYTQGNPRVWKASISFAGRIKCKTQAQDGKQMFVACMENGEDNLALFLKSTFHTLGFPWV
jgi:hypothetical protein